MAYCPNCGTQQAESQRYCGVCGAAQPGVAGFAPMPALSQSEAAPPGGAARVLIGLSLEPPRQSRWSVLFRAILAIPLFFVAWGLEIAMLFVLIAAWFAAMFTGRVPDGIQRFITNVLRFYANLAGYMSLLVARWPGIVWDGRSDDQLTVEVDHVRLRRWAVFFRLLLAIPAGFVSEIVSIGSYLVIFVMWCWGVVTGREPRSLHQGVALVLRFQLRLFAYVCLLTPTQPFEGFFGDGVELEAPARPEPTTADGSGATLPTRWIVAKSAKIAMVVMLIIGIPLFAWQSTHNARLFSRIQSTIALDLVNSTYDASVVAINQFESSFASCAGPTKGNCDSDAANAAYVSLERQSALLSAGSIFPSGSRTNERHYQSALASIERALVVIEDANTVAAQTGVVEGPLATAMTAFNSDYLSLYHGLSS